MRLARFARVRLLRHALPISLLILRKKPTVLQSREGRAWGGDLIVFVGPGVEHMTDLVLPG